MEINAAEFDEIARNVFAPAYRVIAEQIKNNTGKTRGTCIDIGCGGGYLGINLALLTDLTVLLFDKSTDMLAIAAKNIAGHNLGTRVKTLSGDVHNIPLQDNSVDLAVSRGSAFFWEDREKACREIYRILSPGGIAFVGGGFGTAELKKQITTEMLKRDRHWLETVNMRSGEEAEANFMKALQAAGIPEFTVTRKDAGLWMIFGKAAASP
jgi:ubiquinone/menaquinone biosynthesis C-methylase UbiE